jgi:hypothetical protein
MIKMRPIKERRQYYAALEKKGFTDEEVIHLMPMDELKHNAQKGGELAKKELRKREVLTNLYPMPRDIDLDLGV